MTIFEISSIDMHLAATDITVERTKMSENFEAGAKQIQPNGTAKDPVSIDTDKKFSAFATDEYLPKAADMLAKLQGGADLFRPVTAALQATDSQGAGGIGAIDFD
ncbi:MAG: hypothetical protein HOQ24_11765 [Mycobacteriaceae bacterium]|nr:hypothetical protein [Mycobacteriaceae bacterium]